MNPFARLFGIGILGLAGFGLFHIMTDPPDIDVELPSFSAPAVEAPALSDDNADIEVLPGMRMTFDGPTAWQIYATGKAEIWYCNAGGFDVIEGPAHVANVCAAAFYEK